MMSGKLVVLPHHMVSDTYEMYDTTDVKMLIRCDPYLFACNKFAAGR